MNRLISAIAEQVPGYCHAKRFNKNGCRIGLQGAPSERVIVDMDCDALHYRMVRSDATTCSLVGNVVAAWIAPVELKSGKLRASAVLDQLDGGAKAADRWLPPGIPFQLVPVLAHGKAIHRNDLKILRSRKIQLRGQRKRIELIRCGEPLTKALGQ